MPIVATAFLTLLLVFYSGYALRGRNCNTISEMIASSFLYSMLISWLVFLCAYFFNLSMGSLAALIIGVTAGCYWLGNKTAIVSTGAFRGKNLILSLLILLLGAVLVYFTYLYVQKFYMPVFTFWDSVASYNRWAIELQEGKYTVGGAAYPILYPGLWSVIYRLQDDSTLWLISKATLVAAPLSLFIYTISLSLERRSLFPVVFIISCTGLIIFRTPYFLSGMMDIAVVIIGMLSCLLLWKESTEEKSGSLSLLSGGVASMIKQAGLAFLLLAILMKLVEARGLKKFMRNHWKAVLLGLSLPLSFLAFFLLYNDFQQIPGSFHGLKRVAENAANGSELIPHALSIAYAYFPLKIILPISLFFLLGIYFSTPKMRYLSIFSLLIAMIGALIWMFISSYDIRNLYWSLILVIFSASIGLDVIVHKIVSFFKQKKFAGNNTEKPEAQEQYPHSNWVRVLLVSLPLLLLVPVFLSGDSRLQELNISAKNEVIPPALRMMFNKPPPGLAADYGVMTNVLPLGWAPSLAGRIEADLFGGKYKRLKHKLANSSASVLLVKKLPDGGGYPNLQKLKEEGLIQQVSDSKLYAIYLIQR
ncbi:MAG: hypothetical protein L3J24_07390 [Xanthomonadales bacterium]|nr:hypothetical protein [Xanthomonadales bacterium]